ncbi:MAG: hypothetical protein KDB23_27065, partial [Planctomycetales bacterium]|nr:hypothetical protein [Planctomycetales bacterium]
LNQYVADIRQAQATPILCSPIPRNSWRDGQVVKGRDNDYVGWARQLAARENVLFINLNHIVCDVMTQLGQPFSDEVLFRSDDHTHTTLMGAQLNAHCVVAGIKSLGEACDLSGFLSPTAAPVLPARTVHDNEHPSETDRTHEDTHRANDVSGP